MAIQLDHQNKRAHLYNDRISYVMETFEGELIHSYWGKRMTLPEWSPIIPVDVFASFYPNPNPDNPTYSLDTLPREYPDFGRSDYGHPAVRVRLHDGTAITRFVVKSMELVDEKKPLKGLPYVYTEEGDDVQTLKVTLGDQKSGLFLDLYYTIHSDYDAIIRHCEIRNQGQETCQIENLMSASLDFYNDRNFDLIHFPGSWSRERDFSRIPVGRSSHLVESRRGSSSHMQNPLVLLARPETDDLGGQVYAMNFVYSGSFKAVVEVNSMDSTRFQMGLQDFDFSWKLKAGESFTSPEVVMVYSDQGFNGMSDAFHRLYRNRLMRGEHRDKERPVLINNWEATYFEFTEDKLKSICDVASETGLELFVLDDGWFGVRNSDRSGLGDWFVNKDKLPEGLKGTADYINGKGMQFGLWFEPEMISADSDLYRAHPNWILHAKGHIRSQGRNQMVLDYSRRDVQDYIIEVVGNILASHPIEYVKWDMNRNMTEVHSEILPIDRQGEVTHRYMLGLYRVLGKLTERFPQILFESCSGGGGRFDPGMLYYMPQTWTSDDTDAHERLSIQYGTSFAYPPIAMGAHVSVAPNHQVGRMTSLKTRALTSMMANLGYELDLSQLSQDEKDQVKRQVAFYKSIRKDIQFGRFLRLLAPGDSRGTAFMTESPDKKRYYLFYFRGLNRPHVASFTLPLHYLAHGSYKGKIINFDDGKAMDHTFPIPPMDNETLGKRTYTSDFLNRFGYTFDRQAGDFDSHLIIFERCDT